MRRVRRLLVAAVIAVAVAVPAAAPADSVCVEVGAHSSLTGGGAVGVCVPVP